MWPRIFLFSQLVRILYLLKDIAGILKVYQIGFFSETQLIGLREIKKRFILRNCPHKIGGLGRLVHWKLTIRVLCYNFEAEFLPLEETSVFALWAFN